jgi:hypothetical protein
MGEVVSEVLLTKTDARIIRWVAIAFEQFGVPFLLSPRYWKRAKALADRGLLKAGDCKIVPAEEGCDGYLPTQAGIDAYNAQLPKGKA